MFTDFGDISEILHNVRAGSHWSLLRTFREEPNFQKVHQNVRPRPDRSVLKTFECFVKKKSICVSSIQLTCTKTVSEMALGLDPTGVY